MTTRTDGRGWREARGRRVLRCQLPAVVRPARVDDPLDADRLGLELLLPRRERGEPRVLRRPSSPTGCAATTAQATKKTSSADDEGVEAGERG